ncbi:MAG: NAD-dependent deacylase [Bacteroidetes bacterium]|jgi:NAD-dependent deacetylase|nr:NAD-dependent deacylase [Bacteroidota bacterium]
MKKLVALTGAGMSAESGLKTFRDAGGLWEEHDVMEVASIEGWERNPELVLRFYNDRRKQLSQAKPNAGHLALAELEKEYDVQVITQNVDNLHERAGSTNVLHLHGLLTQARGVNNPDKIYEIGEKEIHIGDKADDGSQLRPNIVWFGELVPAIERAVPLCNEADIFVVIGTSLAVYPAAGLINYVPEYVPIYVIDPNPIESYVSRDYEFIRSTAGEGMIRLKEKLLTL